MVERRERVEIVFDDKALSSGIRRIAGQANRFSWLLARRPDRQPGESAPLLWRGDQA